MISEDHQLTVDYHCSSLSLINRTFHFICIIGILLVNIDLSYGQFLNFHQLELNRDLTILIIAHRLTTLQSCDMIVQLEHGRIVKQGSYEDFVNDFKWRSSRCGF